MKTVVFHTPNLNFRGSCVALFDYAKYNEDILGNRSIIVSDRNRVADSDVIAFKWFTNRFKLYYYNDVSHLHSILKNVDCDVFYDIKYGKRDSIIIPKNIVHIVHCVFDMSEEHGTHYIAVSHALAKKYGKGNDYLPHMVSMPVGDSTKTLRGRYNIPPNAIVFGRHGGLDTFNLEFAKSVMSRIVRERNDIYFFFMNAPIWDNHPQIIHIPASTDLETKQMYIQSCDAMIVPETMGHTFGLSIAEFSIHNKPVVCYNGPVWNTSHLEILGEKGIYFSTEEGLYDIINTFNPENYKHLDLNVYRDYSPEKIIRLFEKYLFSE